MVVLHLQNMCQFFVVYLFFDIIYIYTYRNTGRRRPQLEDSMGTDYGQISRLSVESCGFLWMGTTSGNMSEI